MAMRRLALVPLCAWLLAGCTGTDPNAPPGWGDLQRQIVWFYGKRAWERNATCLTPRIIGLGRTRIVEETDALLVLDVRYFWADPNYGRRRFGTGGFFPGPDGDCSGTGQRTFVVAKRADGGGFSVSSMTGPQRT